MKTTIKMIGVSVLLLTLAGCAGTVSLPAGGVRVGIGLGGPVYSPPYGYGYHRGYGYGRGYGYRRGYW